MKNTLEGISIKSDDTEEWISIQENRIVEITQLEDQKEKRIKRNEDSIKDLWENIKCTNIAIMGDPEGEEKEQEIGNLSEKIVKETSLIW